MATTPVKFDFPSGQTLTLDLYAATDLTLAVATGKSCTETSGTGSYSCNVTEALTGLHKAIIEISGSRVGSFWVYMADDTADKFESSAGKLTEGYAAAGAAMTENEALSYIVQHLRERSISSTTETIKKLDGSTTAATNTLDDASNPTSVTAAT